MNKRLMILKEDLEKPSHSEKPLQEENRHLHQQVEKLNRQLSKRDEEKQVLEKKYQHLVSEVDKLKRNQSLEIAYSKKWQAKQVELKKYKERTFQLLEQQKQFFKMIPAEMERIEQERDEVRSALKKTEQNLQDLLMNHQKESCRFHQQVEKLNRQLAKRDEEKQVLEKKHKNLVSEVDKLKRNQSLEIAYSKKWQAKQAELKKYKERTFQLLEQQKRCLEIVTVEMERIERERDEVRNELKKKERNLQELLIRYQKMMSTKIMKWTGKYWKLRKKLQLKNK